MKLVKVTVTVSTSIDVRASLSIVFSKVLHLPVIWDAVSRVTAEIIVGDVVHGQIELANVTGEAPLCSRYSVFMDLSCRRHATGGDPGEWAG